jgi:hypothetical protein
VLKHYGPAAAAINGVTEGKKRVSFVVPLKPWYSLSNSQVSRSYKYFFGFLVMNSIVRFQI